MKLRIISFDGEMLPKLNAMPNSEFDPIMLLSFAANYNIMHDKKKVIFVLNRDKNLPEGEQIRDEDVIVRFNDERRMILGLEFLIKNCDVITGYNIAGFDIPYIIDRAKALNMSKLSIGNADGTLWYRKHTSKGLSVYSIGGVKGKIVFDVLYLIRRNDESNTIKKEFKFKSNKLEDTAKIALGKEKKEFSIEKMIDYWENGTDEEKFINYCSVDSELALEFITKFRLLDKFLMLSKESGKLTQDIIDSQGFGSLVESKLMNNFTKIGRVLPCRGKSSSNNVVIDEDDLAGAFVLEPKLGITDNVASGDYTSLYPTLMIKHNICPTTVILDNTIPDNDNMIIVKNDEDKVMGRFVEPSILKGVIPSIQEELMTKRKLLKIEMKKYEKGSLEYLMYDAQQNATKILLNTFYGFTGEQGNKVYCYQVASSVTGSGRKQIKYTISMIEGKIVSYKGKNYTVKVVASDTDSVYVRVIPEDINEKLDRETVIAITTVKFDEINTTLEKPMKLAPENYVKRMLVTAKKRYTMIIVDENGKESVISKGIETQRKDWCDFATEAMTIANDLILYEKDVLIGTKKVIEFIRNEANKLKNGKIDPHKLILSKSLSKPLTAYDNNAIHVKVAIKMKERGHPSEVGDRIQYIVMDNGKKLIGDQAEEAEYVIKELLKKQPEIISSTIVNIQQKDKNNSDIKETSLVLNTINKNKINYDYYIYNQLFPPIERILTSIGVDKSLLCVDEQQKSLFDF